MKTLITTVAALVLVAGCSGTQPPPPCLAAHGSYAVQYKLVGTAPASGSKCDLSVSFVGVEKYNQVQKEGEPEKLPNLGLRPIELADDTTGSIALGTFAENSPDSKSFCHVDTFANDAVNGTVTYKFSNVALFVNANAPGTQMAFDLTVTDSDPDPAIGCTANYKATAVWPVVSCAYEGGGIPAADKNCTTVDGAMTPGGLVGWSYYALNPTFDVKCAQDPKDWIGWWNGDSVGAFCVLRQDEIPSLCKPNGCDWKK